MTSAHQFLASTSLPEELDEFRVGDAGQSTLVERVHVGHARVEHTVNGLQDLLVSAVGLL